MSYAETNTVQAPESSRTTSVPALVWGAGGLAGAELLRLISTHPHLTLTTALSRSLSGRSIIEIYPSLEDLEEHEFVDPGRWNWSDLPEGPGLIFAALGHGESMQQLPPLLGRAEERGFRVVDLSGDFRLSSSEEYRIHYGKPHAAQDWLGKFIYGLTELNRDKLEGTLRVANPGCFATGAQLAFLPLAGSGISVRALAIDGKTGSTGAGLKPGPSTHHPLRAGNCEAYKVRGHAHLGEILSGWKAAGGDPEVDISFIPQRTPMVRGIYTTVHAFLESPVTEEEIQTIYRDAYADSPLVRLLEAPPAMNRAVGTARCDLSVNSVGRHVVICSAIDNLLKGAAGQAVQNANLMLGLEETAGLLLPPPWPI